MAIRNFWVDTDINGRKTSLSGGPRAKEGGMSINIFQRDEGTITKALRVTCVAHKGQLILSVYDNDDNLVYKFETER